jgi:hypothetical protein
MLRRLSSFKIRISFISPILQRSGNHCLFRKKDTEKKLRYLTKPGMRLCRTKSVLCVPYLPSSLFLKGKKQGITKRCRLSLLTNSALVYKSQCGVMRGGCGVSANEYSCAHHVTWSPNKLWRSTSIFNLW